MIKGIYSRERYLGGVRKIEEYDGLNRRIWERDKERRSATSKEEEGKAEDSWGRIKSRGRRVQEKWVAKKVYSQSFVWMGW